MQLRIHGVDLERSTQLRWCVCVSSHCEIRRTESVQRFEHFAGRLERRFECFDVFLAIPKHSNRPTQVYQEHWASRDCSRQSDQPKATACDLATFNGRELMIKLLDPVHPTRWTAPVVDAGVGKYATRIGTAGQARGSHRRMSRVSGNLGYAEWSGFAELDPILWLAAGLCRGETENGARFGLAPLAVGFVGMYFLLCRFAGLIVAG